MENRSLLIDTSIAIDYLRRSDKPSTRFINLYNNYKLFISVISVFELLNGATTEEKLEDIRKIIKSTFILDFKINCAEKASDIYRNLRKQNKMIEFRDILIGATAISNNLPIATLNKKHFERLTDVQLL